MESSDFIEGESNQPEILLNNEFLISMYLELFQSSGEQFKSLFLKDTITNYSFLLFILLGLTKLYSSKISSFFSNLPDRIFFVLSHADFNVSLKIVYQSSYCMVFINLFCFITFMNL